MTGLPLRVEVAQRLPAVRVVDGGRVEADGEVHRVVDGPVTGVVRVGRSWRPARLVAELVGAVVMAVVENSLAGHVADPGWVVQVGRGGVSRAAESAHQRSEHRGPVGGEQVDRRTVCSDADRLFLVRHGSLAGWAAQRCAVPGADRDRVVGGPSIVDADVHDRERPGDDRRPEPGVPPPAKGRRIPLQHDVVPATARPWCGRAAGPATAAPPQHRGRSVVSASLHLLGVSRETSRARAAEPGALTADANLRIVLPAVPSAGTASRLHNGETRMHAT